MFVKGQRWICDSELDLGLGTVIKSDLRTVTIVFLSSGETRTYSQQTAPLRRASFNIGDNIESHEGWSIKISDVQESNGLITYQGEDGEGTNRQLPEGQLSNTIQLNRPYDRLFSGQVDNNKWFELRNETLLHQQGLSNSELTGLYDSRTSLIPHQLYIAHEVAKRFAPRVLLADEVGLGKTIEACLIMQHQLITGRAKRVLIVVPEALLHQWLVELIRRFNLSFSIFDDERCAAIEASSDFDNPFFAEQLVLCTLPSLIESRERLQQAINGEWDLVILDEAHHLDWSEDNASVEYLAAEALAQQSKGLLLLTATPEQLGKTGHFARLRLLDPQRFHDYSAFLEEESHYQTIATVIDAVLDNKSLEQSQIEQLASWLSSSESTQQLAELENLLSHTSEINEELKQKIINLLLDRHGTGRVLYRNTRNTVKGFPQRLLNLHPLETPEEYSELYRLAQQIELGEESLISAPERLFRLTSQLKHELNKESFTKLWTEFDNRIDFLIDLLEQHKQEKILVICASSATAKELEKTIRTREGLRVSAFHEGLSIIERDRAAGYFADQDSGAQALICSEIGSEGRNFQFAHHLVLFDLPLNPDLLEQRIGRLDRIGQTKDIQIHIPYFLQSPQETLTRWYNEGLNAFTTTCQIGEAVYRKVEPMLVQLLQEPEYNESTINNLIGSTKELANKYSEALQKGRDRLLELNSYKSDIALDLQYEIENVDRNPNLQNFMEKVFNLYGVDYEDFKQGSYLLKPTPRMPAAVFSGISEEGTVITYNRSVALANEDIQFITWNHPFSRDAIDLLLSSEEGNTALIAVKTNKFPPASIIVETNYAIECVFPEANHAGLGVNATIQRYVLGPNNTSIDEETFETVVNAEKTNVDKKTAYTIIKSKIDEIKTLMGRAEEMATKTLDSSINANRLNLSQKIESELERLKTLKQINPNIRQEEIEYYESLLSVTDQRLTDSKLRLDSVRVIMTH